MTLNINSGKISRAIKTVIYGTEGVGKSTLAAEFPGALFLDVEGGTAQMDVRRIEKPATWPELVAIVNEVAKTPGICETLILDTADFAESMCIQNILKKYHKTGIEDFGYGKGYTFVGEEWQKLMDAFDAVIAAGMNMTVIAHAKQRKIEQPDQIGAYDHWEMKLTKQVAPLLKEWADLLLFCNYKTFVVSTEGSNSKKAQGGKRVMYTSHNPAWDAKNRHGLPEEMELSFAGLAGLFGDSPIKGQSPQTPLERLRELMKEAGIEEYQVREIICEKNGFTPETELAEYPEKVIIGCVKYFDKLANQIKGE